VRFKSFVGPKTDAMSAQPDGEDAYIALPSIEQAAAARAVDHPYNFGFVGAMGRLLMAHPRIGAAFQGLFNEIMFAPGALDRQEREMVAAVTASAQTCFY
jgi:alkylhydroperoxidase/carboxymuconolactone decarboxylase family protein YurZ